MREVKHGSVPPPRRGAQTLIFGIHAAEAALANRARIIHRVYLTDNAERHLHDVLVGRGLNHARVLPRDLDRRLGPDTVHQGALIETEPLPETDLSQLVAHAGGRPIVVLDQVTDPHNVGAILRSAGALGTAGIIMTRRHSPALAGALAKSASGALEHVPIARVQNLARALADLRTQHCLLIGLDADGPERLEALAWPERPVLVLGAEGKGLRHLTRQSCDRHCRITTDGALVSLNVSNAAAIALHIAALHRRTGSAVS